MISGKRLLQSSIVLHFVWLISDVRGKEDMGKNADVLSDLEEVILHSKIFKDLGILAKSVENLQSRLEELEDVKDNKDRDLPMFDIRVDELPDKCHTNSMPKNCAEATTCTKRSGIYEIQIEQYNGSVPFLVACDAATADGDWIVIQRRQDGSVDFFRDWLEYQNGFGDVQGEFFIGLNKLHALTTYQGSQELLVILENKNGLRKFAKYTNFAIGNETDQYTLKTLGSYSGTSGDSMSYHVGVKWTTKDRDNDHNADSNCAVNIKAAWWYKACFNSNLNAPYDASVYWKTFTGAYNETLSFVQMMIRRERSHSLLI